MESIDDIIMAVPFQIHGYKIKRIIGRGTFAAVFRAEQIESGYVFAAKVIHCPEKQTKKMNAINSELDCMMRLLHPNIIKIYNVFKEKDFLFLILEYCSRGNIDDYIKNSSKLNELQVMNIMKQLLSALNYCHMQGIAHRDIKPANVLISENGIIKLGDFGLGIQVKENQTIKNFDGSFCFKAPELLRRQEYEPFKADIWSLGVTFYYIAAGTLPWGRTKEEIQNEIITGHYKFPPHTPQTIESVIRKMLVVNPNQRATPQELLDAYFTTVRMGKSPFVSNINASKIPMCLRTRKLVIPTNTVGKFKPRRSLPIVKSIYMTKNEL